MYPPIVLDSPPPSRFRRPWSPEPFDPSPASHRTIPPNNVYDYELDPYSPTRREPSDISVEALDLADYVHTLRRNRDAGNPYPNFYPHHNYSPPDLERLPSPDSL